MSVKGSGFVKTSLRNVHHSLSHFSRIDILSNEISGLINTSLPDEKIKIIDIGCGDMRLAESIGEKMKTKAEWTCIDVFTPSIDEGDEERWGKFIKFDGQNIPFEDGTFKLATICDVLHHDQENASRIVAEAKRVSDYVLIKDHFEYGAFSRQVLRAMDWVGNYGYDVTIPKQYYSQSRFSEMVTGIGLTIETMKVGIDLYEHLPVLGSIPQPKWQFIALLK